MKKLVAMLVVACALLTACSRKEPAVAEIESSSTAVTEVPTVESRILTYEDIKDLPTYSGTLKYKKLYKKYSGNVSLLRKEGETNRTLYYYEVGTRYTYLPDDAACLIKKEYDGYLYIIYKGLHDKLEFDFLEISPTFILPEDLEKLPEEPDWRDPSYVDVVTQHKGDVDLIQNPDIQRLSLNTSLYDASNKLITCVNSDDAIFRNGSTLVICTLYGNNLFRIGYTLPPKEEKDEFYCRANDSPIFCLAEDGLYYYIIEAGEKKVVKVADITNKDYKYSDMLKLENCIFPVFENKNTYTPVTYPLKNAIVTKKEPWFYTVDKIELSE